MESKELGKITSAEVGFTDYMLGLKLEFGGPGWGVGDGCKYSMNFSSGCRYEVGERAAECLRVMTTIGELLAEARVQSVSQLMGKPVEVISVNGLFKEFRILTEVL